MFGSHKKQADFCKGLPFLDKIIIIIWLLHNLVEASYDLFRYLLLGDQLRP